MIIREKLFKNRINWRVVNLLIDKVTPYEDLNGDVKISVRGFIYNNNKHNIDSKVVEFNSIDKCEVWTNKYGFSSGDGDDLKLLKNQDCELVYTLSFLQCPVRKFVDERELMNKIVGYLEKHNVTFKTKNKYEIVFTAS